MLGRWGDEHQEAYHGAHERHHIHGIVERAHPGIAGVERPELDAVAWPSVGWEGVRFVNLVLARQEIAGVW